MKDYGQKRLFHLAFERILLRNMDIVAVQPTPLFFPVMTVFLTGEKRQVSGNRKMKQVSRSLELLIPRLTTAEALMVLEHRINIDFKERGKLDE